LWRTLVDGSPGLGECDRLMTDDDASDDEHRGADGRNATASRCEGSVVHDVHLRCKKEIDQNSCPEAMPARGLSQHVPVHHALGIISAPSA
jgi:hypothetical protein